MDSCKCPITDELFEDPVVGDDGHTYERKAITEWLAKNGTSPITRQPMSIDSLRPNYMVKKMIEEWKSAPQAQQVQDQFELNVDIRKTRTKPLFQGFGKSIYEVEWIHRQGPPVILLKIDGAKANREASFYVRLSCHPHIVRTFGLVQSQPGSVMLLQEYAAHGDLGELLRENEFRPTEPVLWKIFEQICDAMICLVDNGIIHGDLACRNVLVFRSNASELKENLVKLTDFGLTRGSTLYSIVDSPSMSTMTIIPVRYVAPEILRNSDRTSYSEKSDVYSMGVLMWEACSYGQLPYSSLHDDQDVRQRKLNDERLPRPNLCSDQLWHIINECWHTDTSKRPTFQMLKESLLTLPTASRPSQSERSRTIIHQVPDSSSIDTLDDIAHIPCEYCSAQIDVSNYSIHVETCRDTHNYQLQNLARVISQAPITAEFPCEYCQQLCSADELHLHEESCHQNRSQTHRFNQPARGNHHIPTRNSRRGRPHHAVERKINNFQQTGSSQAMPPEQPTFLPSSLEVWDTMQRPTLSASAQYPFALPNPIRLSAQPTFFQPYFGISNQIQRSASTTSLRNPFNSSNGTTLPPQPSFTFLPPNSENQIQHSGPPAFGRMSSERPTLFSPPFVNRNERQRPAPPGFFQSPFNNSNQTRPLGRPTFNSSPFNNGNGMQHPFKNWNGLQNSVQPSFTPNPVNNSNQVVSSPPDPWEEMQRTVSNTFTPNPFYDSNQISWPTQSIISPPSFVNPNELYSPIPPTFIPPPLQNVNQGQWQPHSSAMPAPFNNSNQTTYQPFNSAQVYSHSKNPQTSSSESDSSETSDESPYY